MRHAHHVKRLNFHCTKGSTADTAQMWPSITKDHFSKTLETYNHEQKTSKCLKKKSPKYWVNKIQNVNDSLFNEEK